jgi:hypothetical protein
MLNYLLDDFDVDEYRHFLDFYLLMVPLIFVISFKQMKEK